MTRKTTNPGALAGAAGVLESVHAAKLNTSEINRSRPNPQELRALWWRQARLGYRLPAEPGLIVIDGGRA